MTKKTNDFYKTNASFVFFMSATTIFGLIQVLAYAFWGMEVNGHVLASAPNPLLSWVLLIASIIATYCGFIGGILILKGSLSFLYWQNVATTMAIITQSLAHMWFGAFTSFYFLVVNFVRYYMWKYETVEKLGWSTEKVMWISAIYFVLLFVATNMVAWVWGDFLYGSSAWMREYNRHFDAIGATLNMTAAFIMIFKVRWAFCLYAIAKIFTITNYADAGLIVPIVQMVLFWIMDFTGFIGWSINSIEPEETYIEDVEL